MALESGTYINSLNASNPAATDGIAQADDHMRLIKSTVKASFPGVTGAVTSTHTELNALDGFTGVVADLNYAKDLRATGVTAAELDKLDGFTGTADDLNYAKDLRATGVTSTEYDYLDGVTSNIQTQLAATISNNGNGNIQTEGNVLGTYFYGYGGMLHRGDVDTGVTFITNEVHVKAGGKTHAGFSSNVDGTGVDGISLASHTTLYDDIELRLGNQSGGDLRIYHQSSNSLNRIAAIGGGGLEIQAHQITMRDNGGAIVADFSSDGSSTRLHHAGTVRLKTSTSGVQLYGALSKTSGSFKIDHPLPAKADTHHLVHSFIEGPQADNIYRGKVALQGGAASVDIDAVSGMTDGTFVALNGNIQCFTSNESGFTAVRGSVLGNVLTISAEATDCTDTVSWMVVGERHDPHMIATDWTDDNGKVIVEPAKE